MSEMSWTVSSSLEDTEASLLFEIFRIEGNKGPVKMLWEIAFFEQENVQTLQFVTLMKTRVINKI